VAEAWATQLTRWIDAGLIDESTAVRVRAFEAEYSDASGLRWPVWVALVFGALTMTAGTLLFVSAHWDTLSPAARFALVTALVAVFHVGGALAAERFPSMATTLHAIGTASLGAGIFLAGQIFNLDEHWPGGLMLWTLGAALAWPLLKSWPQTAFVALLAPVWLMAEWSVAVKTPWSPIGDRVSAGGVFLLALAYFTNVRSEPVGPHRRTLVWLGGFALIPAALVLSLDSWMRPFGARALSTDLQIVGWTTAIGLPLIVATGLRRAAAWPNLLAAFWTLVLFGLRPPVGDVSVYVYAWWALGATALAAWGVAERRSERINLGAAIFAATVLAFYFSQVMDKLGRSSSLIGLGLLFLAGGWTIERARRRLVMKARGEVA
jgi:uncharacterized membrane protein